MSNPELHPQIARNLQQMGYAHPRPIQAAVREPALQRRDIIGLAQTGTGKTAAFAAPILHHLLAHRPGATGGRKRPVRPAERLRALIVCPTRELAQQVQRETARIAQGSVLRTASVFGKSAISPQAEAIARGVDIVVGTPGRIFELLEAGHMSLAQVRHVVLDEGDRMMDMGFLPQVQRILDRVGRPRQIMFFSATMPPAMEELARQFLHEPARIEIGRHTTPVQHVTQRLIPVADEHKVPLLLHMLGATVPALRAARRPDETRSGSTSRHAPSKCRGVLIFCRTRRRVGWVGHALERHGVAVGMIHGDRSQAQRQKALERFRDGELDVLVATDVAARGLHIPVVKTVINYDLPMAVEEYVHRIGRAAHGMIDEAGDPGRGGGAAVTLLDPEDRLRWRAVVDATGIEVFAEHEVDGWSPPDPMKRQRSARRSDAREGAGELADGEEPSARDRRARTRRRKGRSHASKPIRKNQKPGGGVKRLKAN